MIRSIDYGALTAPVTSAEVQAFKLEARTRPNYTGRSTLPQAIAVVVVLGFMVFMSLGFFGVVFSFVSNMGEVVNPVSIGAGIFGLLFFGVLALAVVAIVRTMVGGLSRWEKWMRLDRFATANGLVFSPHDPDPQYPGAIFASGGQRAALDHFRSASERFLDYGNYKYVTSNGKSSTTHSWGFMALELDRALPQMVLDSKANNALFGSNLPTFFDKKQILSLEGDFDQYFTLYCPKQYERDALYVFTPDLMALLIDTVRPFDVEIVDKWMFVYSAKPFDMGQPATHQRLLSIVDTVGAKTLSQTDRYSDERVGDFAANVVAPEGRRLRKGLPVGAIVILVLVGLTFFAPFISGAIAAFTGLLQP